jgi:hypothetical protein
MEQRILATERLQEIAMSETFDHAKEFVESNKVATAGALAVAGLALYLTGGKIMSFFKPSVVETGADLAEMGVGRAGLESTTTVGGNEVKELTVHVRGGDFAALRTEFDRITRNAGLIRLAPESASAAQMTELPAGWVKTTLADGEVVHTTLPVPWADWGEAPLSTRLDWTAFDSPIATELRYPSGTSFSRWRLQAEDVLLNDGDIPLVNAAQWAEFDQQLGLARKVGFSPLGANGIPLVLPED